MKNLWRSYKISAKTAISIMSGFQRHLIYSQDTVVYLETGTDEFQVMQQALEVSGFLDHQETAYNQTGKSRAVFLGTVI